MPNQEKQPYNQCYVMHDRAGACYRGGKLPLNFSDELDRSTASSAQSKQGRLGGQLLPYPTAAFSMSPLPSCHGALVENTKAEKQNGLKTPRGRRSCVVKDVHTCTTVVRKHSME